MKKLLLIIALVLLACGIVFAQDNSARAGRAGGSDFVPGENGGDSGGSSVDVALPVGADWFATTAVPPAFFWSAGFLTDPADGFQVAGPARIDVTDDFCPGDQFEVFVDGISVGTTSAVPSGTCLEVGPQAAFDSPDYSSGSFDVGPGNHQIDIRVIVDPFGSGRGYIRAMGGGGTVVFKTPNYNGPTDLNVYLVQGQSGAPVDVRATDACLAGDVFLNLGIGLPGPNVQFDVTDGTAEGCACAPSGGWDAMFSLAGSSVAIVLQRYLSGTDVFPASSEMEISSPASIVVTQVRGSDACGF
ncbi:MAG: hypothetical protein ACE5JX_17955 [Acidobacteriota bacterium]